MELFRTISPNGGSISAIEDARQAANASDKYGDGVSPYLRLGLPTNGTATPHTATSFDPRHWRDPQRFDPERYRGVPTSDQIGQGQMPADRVRPVPFRPDHVRGERRPQRGLRNNGFGTVFGIADGRPLPVCDYAGFRALRLRLPALPWRATDDPGLRGLPAGCGRDKITFHRLNLPNPGRIPIGPNAVIDDDIGFNGSI